MQQANTRYTSSLLLKRLTGSLTPDEASELRAWIEADPRHRLLADMILDTDALTHEYRQLPLVNSETARQEMQARIRRAEAPRRHRRIISAAAAIAVIITGALWMLTSREQSHPHSSAEAPHISLNHADSIPSFRPGVTKALLHAPSGKSISLSASDTVTPLRQLLSETTTPSAKTTLASRELCLEVPRGGEFKITLEDSTEVWLNSGSTLRYPETFGPHERRVEISGEAYFAVRRDASRPFFVVTRDQRIQVYGTTFNVRDYPEDEQSYTTLETGSIALRKLDGNGGEVHLSPGHQAIFHKDSATLSMTTVNPAVITGWRHGRFVFEGQTLLNIMRDLARWYNFEFEFTDRRIASIVFNGSIPRYADFTTAITILENCGDIDFSVSDGRVIVSLIR